MPPLQIGIAGFGIAGGAAAVLLARQGHAVTLLERASALGPVGAGFLLQPSGQGVLERLGLLAGIAAASEPLAGLKAFTHRGGKLIELGYGAGLQALGVRRGLVFETLHAEVRRAGAGVELAWETTGWRDTPQGPVAIAADGREAGPFDLLLAADGARSRLRRLVDPDAHERDDPYAALWAMGPCRAVQGHLLQITRGTRQLTGLLPIGSGRCNFFWGLKASDWPELRRSSFASFRDLVLALNPLAEEIFTEVESFDAFVLAGYRHALPARVVSGRVALIGDAGHATTPHLGQGANLALLDAECLAQALEAEPGLEAALARYQRRRRAQNRYYVQLSRWLSPLFQSDLTFWGPLRDFGLPLLPLVPPIRRMMERSLAGMKEGWTR